MALFPEFPYTNFHELNNAWMLKELKKILDTMEQFVAINSLKYADPIQWDITTQYEKNTIVIEPTTGIAYISVQAVPSGVGISNTDYWTPVFDLSVFITRAGQNFADTFEANTTTTATKATLEGGWIVWDSILYEALTNISVGDAYVPGGNIEQRTVEYFFNLLKQEDARIELELSDLIASEASVRASEDTRIELELRDLIASEVNTRASEDARIELELSDLIASEASVRASEDARIELELRDLISSEASIIAKSKHCVTPEEFDAVGDGVTDDSTAFQDCVDYAIANDYDIVLPHSYALYNINITGDITFRGGEVISILSAYNQTQNIFNSNSNCNIKFVGVKINGSATARNDVNYPLQNMIRFENAKSVEFIDCEICNHAQSDINPDETAWYLRRIDAINCIDCNRVVFNGCYIHDNHTEQIAIGSRYATTEAIITNNISDNDSDGYALFLLFNLKKCIFDGNNLQDCKRTFVNVLTNNIIISNNTFKGTQGRCIASEGWAHAMRLKNVKICDNYIADGLQGGIDCGIFDCTVSGNTIENCQEYAINMCGRVSGDDPMVVTDGLPWEVNTLQNGKNVKINNNLIINQSNSGTNRPAGIAVRGERFTNNGASTYGSVRQIEISNNTVILNDVSQYGTGIMLLEYNIVSDIMISNNVIRNYNDTAIALSYYTGAVCDTIDTVTISNNIFDAAVSAHKYSIANYTAPHIKDVSVTGNTVLKPSSNSIFGSPIIGSISGGYKVEDNITNGSPEVLRDNRYHVNGYIPNSNREIAVNDLTSIPSGISFNPGDEVRLIAPTSGADNMLICNTSGTSGSVTSITGTGSQNTNKLTVNNASVFKVGNIIQISGITGNYIVQYISGNNLYLASVLAGDASGAAVSLKQPRFLTGLNMTLV